MKLAGEHTSTLPCHGLGSTRPGALLAGTRVPINSPPGLSLWRLAFVVVDLVARFTSLGHDVRGRFWCSWLLRLTETRPFNRFELSGRSPQARKRPWLPRRWADLCSITADSVMRGTYRVWSSPAVSRETTTRPLSKLRAKSGETCAPMSPRIRSILLAKPGEAPPRLWPASDFESHSDMGPPARESPSQPRAPQGAQIAQDMAQTPRQPKPVTTAKHRGRERWDGRAPYRICPSRTTPRWRVSKREDKRSGAPELD